MAWEPFVAEQQSLVVVRVGVLVNEARIYLRAKDSDIPAHVIRLSGLFNMFDSLPRDRPVRIADVFPHGSFGYDAPRGADYHSLKLSVEHEAGFLMALARDVEYRMADRSEAINWPG